LRTDSTTSSGQVIPNGGTVPAYYSINCGAEQSFKLHGSQFLKARLDIVNLTGDRYILFCGVDDLVLESVLLGAVGWVAGLGNVLGSAGSVSRCLRASWPWAGTSS
jgi:hypothetical protein